MPRLIPLPPDPITIDQAEAILGHYAFDAGELAAGVAMTLRDRGRIVHFWTVLDADELVRTWNPPSASAIVALVHYAPSQSVPFDAVQIRLDKIAGELDVWESRGVLIRPASSA